MSLLGPVQDLMFVWPDGRIYEVWSTQTTNGKSTLFSSWFDVLYLVLFFQATFIVMVGESLLIVVTPFDAV